MSHWNIDTNFLFARVRVDEREWVRNILNILNVTKFIINHLPWSFQFKFNDIPLNRVFLIDINIFFKGVLLAFNTITLTLHAPSVIIIAFLAVFVNINTYYKPFKVLFWRYYSFDSFSIIFLGVFRGVFRGVIFFKIFPNGFRERIRNKLTFDYDDSRELVSEKVLEDIIQFIDKLVVENIITKIILVIINIIP